ncbi:serine/threonine-protein kinase [Streptomyces fulvoviolaceus]|uniref:serine/threonine-protein kinase n=1 Tax=Streptomyces fulvoviolaceus TaxID=285535 RepID=UPI0021BF705B|nr:protein kinase [Streptomyces fulvoviolaceus]MCT9084631.1 protein kinase [Streptomyces fulvoviolaceus]
MRSGEEFADRYVLKEVIGAGRGGDVWLAHDTVVGQDVALKPERTDGEGETAVRRLLGEPRAMAKFRDHPHVVTLFDVVTVEPDDDGGGADTYWFVMEYVPGGGLDGQPPVSPERAARIGAQLADALAALHEEGIVHCDVKPANIGLTRRGDAKLLDFGAAYRAGGSETITVNGPYSYTPDYAAPELARGNVPRPASDVFCLAATLHALVTGVPPRGGEPGEKEHDGHQEVPGSWENTERLRRWQAEQGVVEMDADAVGPLYPVLAAMLRHDPRQRPDATEVRRLLEDVAAGAGPQALGDTATPDTVTGRRRRHRPLIAAALGVGAVLALGLVVIPGDGDDGKATSAPGQSRQEEAQALIGDPHTADVCALADTAALDQFANGDVHKDVDYGNFDRCEVLVGIDDKTRIDVSIRLLQGSPPEGAGPSRTIGRIGILEDEADSDECNRLLTADGNTEDTLVQIRVNMGKGSVTGGNATLCTVAEKAATGAAEVLDGGPVPRRAQAYPKASLAWANACKLLDAEALTVVPGLKTDVPDAGIANWGCEWSSTVDGLDAEVGFFRDQPKSAQEGTVLTLSGYRTVVESNDDGDTCTAFVEDHRYSGQDAVTAAEMVRLDVGGEQPTDELCGMAKDLAASAAAELRAR